MAISEPGLEPLPAGNNKAVWTRNWATWFTEVWRALMGWKTSYYGTLTNDWGTVNAHSEGSKTVTITGTRTGDNVVVNSTAKTTGVVEVAVATATDTVTVYAQNTTGGNISVGSKTYKIVVLQQ